LPFQLSRIRVPSGFVLAALFLYFSQPTWPSLAIGLFIAALGLLMRVWATGHLKKNDQLATSGPYALTRNPLYLGSFLIGTGFTIAGRNLVILIIFLLGFWAVYWSTIRLEATRLKGLFPEEYDHYRDRVPLFFPRFWSIERGDGFSLGQYRKNREYRALIGFLGAVMVLLLKIYYS
jgi:protein-S-isoprenylcysteine O-methyltransferase Ste14